MIIHHKRVFNSNTLRILQAKCLTVELVVSGITLNMTVGVGEYCKRGSGNMATADGTVACLILPVHNTIKNSHYRTEEKTYY